MTEKVSTPYYAAWHRTEEACGMQWSHTVGLGLGVNNEVFRSVAPDLLKSG